MSDSELTAPASTQLFEAREEPATLTVPEPIVSVPENTAVAEPVGVGQPRRVTDDGNEYCGSVASVAPGVVGN